MKILEINKFFYRKGGSEAYMFELRDLLKAKGHTVMDFAMNHPRNEPSKYQKYFTTPVDFDSDDGLIRNIKKAFHLIYSFDAKRNLEQLIKDHGAPDVAHIHNFSYQLTPSIISVLKKYNVPIVWTLHDYKVVSPNYNLFKDGKVDESTKPDKYFRCVMNRCVKNSFAKSFLAACEMWWHYKVTGLYDQIDAYVPPSKFLGDLVAKWGIPKKKIHHVYNFIDLDEYSPKFEPGEYFVIVARLIEEKGVRIALEAFRRMPKQQLVIVGGGEMEDEIAEYISENNLTNVIFKGPVYPPKVFDVIREARALIIPSIWYENNPIVVLQAMALGKPIIGSNMGGIPELIDDGTTGFVYQALDVSGLEDTIKKFGNLDIGKQLRMGEAARKKVEGIADKESHYMELMIVFDKVIKT